MTLTFDIILNWVPKPIWFSRRGTRYLSTFPREQICWYGLCIIMNQFLQRTPFWYPFIPQEIFPFFWCFELTLVLRENTTSASGNSVATWSSQVHQWFLWSSIYYTNFLRIHSTSALYSPVLPSYQSYQTPKSKGENHCFDYHHHHKKKYQIPLSLSLRANMLIWNMHQNEPMSTTYPFLISFD